MEEAHIMAKLIGSEISTTINNRSEYIQLGVWGNLSQDDQRLAARPKGKEILSAAIFIAAKYAPQIIQRAGIEEPTITEYKADRCSKNGSAQFEFLGNGYSKVVFTPRCKANIVCKSNLVYKFSLIDKLTKGSIEDDGAQNIMEISLHQKLLQDSIAGKNDDLKFFAYMYAAYKQLGIIISERCYMSKVGSLREVIEYCNNYNGNQNIGKQWLASFEKVLNKYNLCDVVLNGGNMGCRLNPNTLQLDPIVIDYGLQN